ncbi:MAG: ABC transporter permease, partial [Chloroflexota bacterium]
MRSKINDGTPRASVGLKLATLGALLFLHLPLLVVILYAFTTDEAAFTFPPPGLTTRWFSEILTRTDFRQALGLSITVALVATFMALVMGTLLS